MRLPRRFWPLFGLALLTVCRFFVIPPPAAAVVTTPTPTVTRTPTPPAPPPPVLATLEGWVFLDADQDGVFDGGEVTPPVPVTVALYREGVLVKTAVTSGGYYAFASLTPGVTYWLALERPAGYVSTSPSVITVTHPGGRLIDQNFGLWTDATGGTPAPDGLRGATLRQGLEGYAGASDAHLDRYQPTTARGGAASLYLASNSTDGDARSILLDFDLSALALPPAAHILQARLYLYLADLSGSPNLETAAYAVQRAWAETEATWQQAAASAPWAVPGANGAPADIADEGTRPVPLGSWAGWRHWDVTAIVQGWVGQPASQHGLKLVPTLPGDTTARFHAREAADAALRPRLEVWYVIPLATVTPTATPTGGPLPDLTVTGLTILEAPVTDCQVLGPLGTRVTIRNNGDAAAGPFVVELNGIPQDVTGLAAGAAADLFFEGYAAGHETVATVDATNLVAESDETNNTLAQMVPIPTPRATCTPTVTPTAPATPTPTATATASGPLPDLTVTGLMILEAPVTDCQVLGPLGTRVTLRNAGDAAAGPFVVELNGIPQDVAGLAAGAEADLFFEGYAAGHETVATVDATHLVSESDETNNTLAQMVPIPTPRATCTPTVTPTATATATPTVVPRRYLPLLVQ